MAATTTLQKITTRAKQIRKAHPKKAWTDCIKAASKEIKAGKKVAGYVGTRRDGNKTTVSYTKTTAAKKKAAAPKKVTQAKLFGTSKKHTDTKSHNINVKIGSMNKNKRYHITLDNDLGDTYSPFAGFTTKKDAWNTLVKWGVPKAIDRYNDELKSGRSVTVYLYDNELSEMVDGYLISKKGNKISKKRL